MASPAALKSFLCQPHSNLLTDLFWSLADFFTGSIGTTGGIPGTKAVVLPSDRIVMLSDGLGVVSCWVVVKELSGDIKVELSRSEREGRSDGSVLSLSDPLEIVSNGLKDDAVGCSSLGGDTFALSSRGVVGCSGVFIGILDDSPVVFCIDVSGIKGDLICIHVPRILDLFNILPSIALLTPCSMESKVEVSVCDGVCFSSTLTPA